VERRRWDFSSGVATIGCSLLCSVCFGESTVFADAVVVVVADQFCCCSCCVVVVAGVVVVAVVLLTACNIFGFFAQCSLENTAHTHTHNCMRESARRYILCLCLCLLTLLLLLSPFR